MNASAKTLIIFWSTFWVLSFVNPNTWQLICNNFNLNFIFGTVCLFVCVCAFSLRRESPDMILGDKPLISEVVLSEKSPPVDGKLLGLPNPYHRHVIGTFNTYSWGSTHRSFTNTSQGYNHLRALPSLRLSNLNIASSKSGANHLSPIRGLSTTQRLPKSMSMPSHC
jgi:hypothetical protein